MTHDRQKNRIKKNVRVRCSCAPHHSPLCRMGKHIVYANDSNKQRHLQRMIGSENHEEKPMFPLHSNQQPKSSEMTRSPNLWARRSSIFKFIKWSTSSTVCGVIVVFLLLLLFSCLSLANKQTVKSRSLARNTPCRESTIPAKRPSTRFPSAARQCKRICLWHPKTTQFRNKSIV